jgi:multicomponent Na+:H+ antiporter subunit A
LEKIIYKNQQDFNQTTGLFNQLHERLLLPIEWERMRASMTRVGEQVISIGTTDANGLYLVNLPANALENGSITLLLVKNFTGALSNDLDTDNNGVFDSTPWDAIVDAVAVNDGGAGDVTYGLPVLGVAYDGLPFAPGGASRIPDGVDTDTAADWVRNDFDLAGIPPFVGFIGKEFLYKAGLDLDVASLWVTGTIFAASVLMFVAAGISVLRPFTGPLAETPYPAHEGPWAMWIGPLILGAFSLGFGLFPNTIEAWLVAPGTWAVYGDYSYVVDLYLFKEVNAAFILSLVTFATGAAVYLVHRPLRDWLGRVFAANPIKFDPGWDRVLDGLKALAAWQTGILQSGVLQRYIFTVFATLAIAIGGTIWAKDALNFRVDWAASLSGLAFMHFAVLVFIIAGAIMAAITSNRMTAIASLGVVGIGVSLIFIMFSAPDVAITQLLVETLSVVLVAVVMLKLPQLGMRREQQLRPFHLALSVVMGGLVTLVLIGVVQGDIDRRLTDYFEVTSLPEAFGANIVNVILVDFRAIDTFGEIAVVAIAALASYALLRSARYGAGRDKAEEDRT